MKYIHKYISESDFIIIQDYENGFQREVSKERPAYLQWLSEGNSPEDIAYVPPVLPDLAIYKQQKKEMLGNLSAHFCAELSVERVAGMTEKFTQEVRDSMLARFTELTRKEITTLLTEAEQLEMNYLLSIWEQIKTIQSVELSKKAQVDAAADHAAVDSIVWED